MKWPGTGTLVATCAGGTESVVAGEIRALGFSVVNDGTAATTGSAGDHGAVIFAGGVEEMVRANIELRAASRILVPIIEGRAGSSEELYRLARQLNWGAIIPPDRSFRVSAFSKDAALSDSRFLALKIKDAIADSQRAKRASRSDVDKRTPAFGVSLFVSGGTAQIALDSSWPALHERGYRIEGGSAPLRETLAAALLLYSGWDGTVPFCDPFCGSGTVAIEAALIASGISPGTLRDGFGYQKWGFVDARLHDRCIDDARRRRRAPAVPIHASDIDGRVVAIARQNARRAGVDAAITFAAADFFESLPPVPTGVVVTNPPYGERIELADADEFYRDLGRGFKASWPDWEINLLSANRTAMKQFGLRTNVRARLRNGALDAGLYTARIFPPRVD